MNNYKIFQFKTHDKSKPVILVDFDHTLSDFEIIKNNIIKNGSEYGLTKEIYNNTYFKNDLGVVYIEPQIEKISKVLNIDMKIVENWFDDALARSVESKFPDVDDFLSKYANLANIYLFSLGDADFQFLKRYKLEIDRYLTGAVYTTAPKYEVIESNYGLVEWLDKDSEIYFIDDRAVFFNKLVMKPKFHLFRLKRENGKYRDEIDTNQVEIITSLNEFHFL